MASRRHAEDGTDDGLCMTPDASAAHITYRRLRIRGLGIHAEICGEGEPLLLHSGMWAEAGLWGPLLPYLAGYQVIAFDPPGVGRSQMPTFPPGMRELASFGAAVLDELGIESAHVLGASFGGAVAQQMAIGHPDRVRRLVLVSTSFGGFAVPGDPAALWQFFQPANYYDPAQLAKVAGATFGGRLRAEPELVHTLQIRPPQSLRAPLYRMAPLFGWTSLPWLRAIRQPTLIVSGDDDPVTPPINHRIMAALIPDAQFRTVKGGGHLMLIDSPAHVAPVITTFLNGSQP